MLCQHSVTLVSVEDPNTLLKELSVYHLIDLNIEPETLEEVFMKYYGVENNE